MVTALPNTASQPLKGIALLLLACVIFASYDTVAKYLTGFYPVLLVVWARYIVHAGLMSVLFMPRQGLQVLRSKRPRLQILRALSLLATTLFFTWALSYLPLGEATAINFLAPLFVTALSWPLLGEAVSRGQWIAVLTGFAGVLLIVHPGAELFTPAALLPVCSALCFCFYQLLTRHLAQFDSAETSNLITGVFNAALLSLLLPWFWQLPSIEHMLLMLLLGACGMFSQLIFTHAYRYAPAALLAPFGYCQIIVAGLFGMLFFAHIPDVLTLLGVSVICVSGVFSMLLSRR